MKLLEKIKTIAFVGLFVSALVMVAVYIVGAPGRSADEQGNLPAEVLATLRGGDPDDSAGFLTEQMLPAFLGIRHGGGQEVGIRAGAEMMEDLVEILSPWFDDVLGSDAVCTTLAADEGNALWRSCMTRVNYFYMNWNFSVPAALLRAHCLPKDTLALLDTASGDQPRIREIFFLPGSADDLIAVSRDCEGRVSSWRLDRSVQIRLPGIAAFSAYLERNVFAPFRFAGLLDARTDERLVTLPVFDSVPLADVIVTARPLAEVVDSTRISEPMLSLFAYNLNKLGSYYEADTDTVIYIETHGTLRAAADSIHYEATASGGIPVTDFVHETDVGALTLRDDLVACENFVAQLREADRACLGGTAIPMLTDIGMEDDTLVVDFAYFYDNIRIAAEMPSISLVVRGHQIISVRISALTYHSADEQMSAGGQTWMRNLAQHISGGYELRLEYIDHGAGRLSASWNLYQFD